MRHLAIASLVFAAIGAPLAAHASAKAYPSALSARLVKFVYNPNQTYTIYTRPGMETDLRIPSGSKLVGLVLGDTTRWITSDLNGSNNVFVKPVRAGIETSGTLVTTRRTYQVMLVSRKKGAWYQQVKFNPNNSVAVYNPQAAASLAHKNASKLNPHQSKHVQKAAGHQQGGGHHQSGRHKHTYDAFSHVNLAKMHFHWHVSGKTSFAPHIVFSSKKFVWLKIPADAASPVIFAQSKPGSAWHIINYDRRGHWDVVQGSPEALKLVANGHQVYVTSPHYRAADHAAGHVYSGASSHRVDPFGGGH